MTPWQAPLAAGVYWALQNLPGPRLASAGHPRQLNHTYFRACLNQTGSKYGLKFEQRHSQGWWGIEKPALEDTCLELSCCGRSPRAGGILKTPSRRVSVHTPGERKFAVTIRNSENGDGKPRSPGGMISFAAATSSVRVCYSSEPRRAPPHKEDQHCRYHVE